MEIEQKNCLNCNYQLEEDFIYCKNCGQKTIKSLLSVKELLTNIFATIGNLDGPFFRSMRFIFKPWKLTEYYIAGVRKPYLHPSRLFIIMLVTHFALLLAAIKIDNKKLRSSEHFALLEKSNLYDKFITLQAEIPHVINNEAKDTIIKELFKSVKSAQEDVMVNSSIFSKDYSITRSDALLLTSDSLFRKYKIDSFIEKLIVSQYIKIDLDRAGSLRYFIKNFGWSVILITIILALFYKLLYLKSKKFFVEHLIFWFNIHSTSFFIMTLGLLLYKLFEIEVIDIFGLLMLIVIYIAHLMFYKQGIIKTSLKLFVTGLFYSTICILIGAIFSIISLLIF
ncbi:MAG TPA: DUF3667 domain-containing protein [Saprospiraceae bacterium]|nr:DUF3667 domain-containing protein [Saprospiraceae bacterium]